jgi:hypothetical protein
MVGCLSGVLCVCVCVLGLVVAWATRICSYPLLNREGCEKEQIVIHPKVLYSPNHI